MKLGVEQHTSLDRSSLDEERSSERAGRGADHKVDATGHPELFEGDEHSRRHDASHPSAFDRKGEAVVVCPVVRRGTGRKPFEDDLSRRGQTHVGHRSAPLPDQ